jgi:hypothetical protein
MTESDRQAERLATEVEINDLVSTMRTKIGRRLLYRVLDRCGVFRSSFTGNAATYFREGERNIGLWLMDRINRHALDEYVLMIRENARRPNEPGSRSD